MNRVNEHTFNISIELIRSLYNAHKVMWTQHSTQRLSDRDISIEDVSTCLNLGKIIEEYLDDYPNPSCLVLGLDLKKEQLHVVVGCDGQLVYIITAYRPTEDKFESDGITRKGR